MSVAQDQMPPPAMVDRPAAETAFVDVASADLMRYRPDFIAHVHDLRGHIRRARATA